MISINYILNSNIYSYNNNLLTLLQYRNSLTEIQKIEFDKLYKKSFTDDYIINEIFDDEAIKYLTGINKNYYTIFNDVEIFNSNGNIYYILKNKNILENVYNKIKNKKINEKKRFIKLLFDNNKYSCRLDIDYLLNFLQTGDVKVYSWLSRSDVCKSTFYCILKQDLNGVLLNAFSDYEYNTRAKNLKALKTLKFINNNSILLDISRTLTNNKKDYYSTPVQCINNEYYERFDEFFRYYFKNIKPEKFNFEKFIKQNKNLIHNSSYYWSNTIHSYQHDEESARKAYSPEKILDIASDEGYDVGKYKLMLTI